MKPNTRKLPVYLTLVLALVLGACSSDEKLTEELQMSEEQLYQRIQSYITKERFVMASESIETLEARFPFGKYAEKAQLEYIYALYMQSENDAAAVAAERFIRLHPQHPNVDYAYYMKGLCSFTEGEGFFERFLPTDVTKRDPGAARQSFADFSQLLSRFPDSPYAADARKRMIYLRNLLARNEVHVANYYFTRGAYLAAANRGRYVIENFQRTPAVPDALAVMVQAYKLLGMEGPANDALATLKYNYPDHMAFDENGEFVMHTDPKRSWLNLMTFGLVSPPPPMGFDSRTDRKGW